MPRSYSYLPTLLFIGLCHASTCHATTYYVSASGDDNHSGTSPENAWETIARVNQSSFRPGDKILFEGPQTFQGPLIFGLDDAGTAEAPIVVSSYPLNNSTLATIDAGEGKGIDVYNTSGVCITNLRIVGDGADKNTDSGIEVHTSLAQGASHIRIERVNISGFGKHGISLGASDTSEGYSDVAITNCTIFDNLKTGILTWGPWGKDIYAHSNLHIANCEVFGMKGGSGITLSSVNGATVEHCVSHDNGEEFSGAAGIWAWNSKNILFQHNESYGNRTIGVDGDGFDFDGGVTDSVMQYNYSHDNDAAGYLLAQYVGAPVGISNIVIRYNISENDCRKKNYGAIHLWNGEEPNRISNVQIYQNTVYINSVDANIPSAVTIAAPTTAVAIRNNLFVASGSAMLVSTVPDQIGIKFQSNAYWSGDNPFHIEWNGSNYTSLDAWLQVATDQERLGQKIVAIHADPMLVDAGGAGTLTEAGNIEALSAYKLRPGSPLINRGLNLKEVFGIEPGSDGFFGSPISKTSRPSIGANVAAGTM